jgi:hypothetical protein
MFDFNRKSNFYMNKHKKHNLYFDNKGMNWCRYSLAKIFIIININQT